MRGGHAGPLQVFDARVSYMSGRMTDSIMIPEPIEQLIPCFLVARVVTIPRLSFVGSYPHIYA